MLLSELMERLDPPLPRQKPLPTVDSPDFNNPMNLSPTYRFKTAWYPDTEIDDEKRATNNANVNANLSSWDYQDPAPAGQSEVNPRIASWAAHTPDTSQPLDDLQQLDDGKHLQRNPYPDSPLNALRPLTPSKETIAEKLNSAIDRTALAFNGLRRHVETRKYEKGKKSLPNLEHSIAVRQENARAQQFDTLPREGYTPTTKAQQREALLSSLRTAQLVKLAVDQKKQTSIYGATDELGRPRLLTDENGKPIKDDRYNYFTIPVPNDLGTPEWEDRLRNGDYSQVRIKAERRAAERVRQDEVAREKLIKKIDGTISGRGKLGKKVDRIRSTPDRVKRLDEDTRQRRRDLQASRMTRDIEAWSRRDVLAHRETTPITKARVLGSRAVSFASRGAQKIGMGAQNARQRAGSLLRRNKNQED